VGYPFGYQRTETKQLETELALKDGANEIEVVINTSALFSPSSVWLKIEFAKLVTQVHEQEKLLTVVLESTLLDEQQQLTMIKLATDAGCDFIKNATGAISMNFSLETALQFRRNVPKSVGVKIVVDGATEAELEKLVAAGVERLALGQAIR
jgi:deoxyribose-phosphate aldolase